MYIKSYWQLCVRVGKFSEPGAAEHIMSTDTVNQRKSVPGTAFFHDPKDLLTDDDGISHLASDFQRVHIPHITRRS